MLLSLDVKCCNPLKSNGWESTQIQERNIHTLWKGIFSQGCSYYLGFQKQGSYISTWAFDNLLEAKLHNVDVCPTNTKGVVFLITDYIVNIN